MAEIPGWCVATRYAAQNHVRSGVRVPCITVPAVTDVCWPQDVHTQRCRRVSPPLRPPPQPGHANPSGQREANRYSRQASSVAKRSWNSKMLRGYAGRDTPRSYETARMQRTGYALFAYLADALDAHARGHPVPLLA